MLPLGLLLFVLLLLSALATVISIDRRLAITTYGSIDYSCSQANSWITNSTHYNSLFGKTTDIINISYVSTSSDFQVGFYGIPNYGRIFDTGIMSELSTHKTAKSSDFEYPRIGTTANLGEVYEFGANIGYSTTKGGCMGYWPPGPACPGVSFKTELVSLLPSPEMQTKGCYALSGSQGTWVNGVYIYAWGDGSTYNDSGVWSQLAMEFERYAMDVCTGHAAGALGYYHHHSYSKCLASQLQDDGAKHSPIYGWVNDGYPIYGPYQSNGVLATSCWQKRNYSSTTTGCSDGTRSCLLVDEYDYTKGTTSASSNGPDPSGTTKSTSVTISAASGVYYQDYYYNSTCGNLGGAYLNSYNGHDHDDLGFHYHITIDASGNNVFPYTFGPKFYGCTQSCCTVINADNTCKRSTTSTCSSTTQGISLSNAQCLNGIKTETWKPTASPTNAPSTSKPSTRTPTFKPSLRPTGPTYSPSSKPSNPSNLPTILPTAPTLSPTIIPTSPPSFKPSASPTYLPTNPTVAPSKIKPTCNPSYCPTNVPSVMPSVRPSITTTTRKPSTMSPTVIPSTTRPSTINPSYLNSITPSSQIPVVTPTSEPSTAIPSYKPTTVTIIPSTARPSTINPTYLPSIAPSSQMPSVMPSSEPSTAIPSYEPTIAPIIGTKMLITFASNIEFGNLTSETVSTSQFSGDFIDALSNILLNADIPASDIEIATAPSSFRLENIRILSKSAIVNEGIAKIGTEYAILYFELMIILENTAYTSPNSLQGAVETTISASCSNGDLLSYLIGYDISTLSVSPITILSETILDDDRVATVYVHPHDLSVVFLVVIIIGSLVFCAITRYVYKSWKVPFSANLDQLDSTNSEFRPSFYGEQDYANNQFGHSITNPVLTKGGKYVNDSAVDDMRPSNFDVGLIYGDKMVQLRPLSKSDFFSQYTKHLSNKINKKSEEYNPSEIYGMSKNISLETSNPPVVVGSSQLPCSKNNDIDEEYRPSNFEIGAVYGNHSVTTSMLTQFSNISRGFVSNLRPKSSNNSTSNTDTVIYDTSKTASVDQSDLRRASVPQPPPPPLPSSSSSSSSSVSIPSIISSQDGRNFNTSPSIALVETNTGSKSQETEPTNFISILSDIKLRKVEPNPNSSTDAVKTSNTAPSWTKNRRPTYVLGDAGSTSTTIDTTEKERKAKEAADRADHVSNDDYFEDQIDDNNDINKIPQISSQLTQFKSPQIRSNMNLVMETVPEADEDDEDDEDSLVPQFLGPADEIRSFREALEHDCEAKEDRPSIVTTDHAPFPVSRISDTSYIMSVDEELELKQRTFKAEVRPTFVNNFRFFEQKVNEIGGSAPMPSKK